MAKRAIDVSNWQGHIKKDVWSKNRDKIPMVILRSSVTMWRDKLTIEEDKSFEANIKSAHKAGMRIGIYHYSQARSEAEAIKEAKFCLDCIRPFKDKISLPVAFDFEFGGRLTSAYAKKIGKQRMKQIADAFCRTIRNAGFQPMVYANLSTLTAYIASDIYKYYPIWVAQYHSRCDYKHKEAMIMWQYTSSGIVSGISGKVDLNWFYGQSAVSAPSKKETYKYELPKLPHRGWFSSGDTGEEVKKLQRFLNAYGDYGLKVDGVVGRKTIEAVRYYQGREKLKVDGAFGKDSLARAKVVKI